MEDKNEIGLFLYGNSYLKFGNQLLAILQKIHYILFLELRLQEKDFDEAILLNALPIEKNFRREKVDESKVANSSKMKFVNSKSSNFLKLYDEKLYKGIKTKKEAK